MKRVRFNDKYCADINNRMSYELVSDEPECFYLDYPDGRIREYEEFYNLKLLGWIPTRKLEPVDGTEIEAIDVWIELGKQ